MIRNSIPLTFGEPVTALTYGNAAEEMARTSGRRIARLELALEATRSTLNRTILPALSDDWRKVEAKAAIERIDAALGGGN